MKKERYHYEKANYSAFKLARRHQIALELFKNFKGGRVIEIGCGNGLFLKELLKFGKFNCLGIDLLPELVEMAKMNGVNAIQKDIDNGINLEPESADYVVCFEMIDHLIKPIDVLKEIYHILKPGGHLILETVNSAYWRFRLEYLFAKYKYKNPDYNSHYEIAWLEHKGMHLHHFSHDSMKELLKSIGFKVVCHCGGLIHNFQMEMFFDCIKE